MSDTPVAPKDIPQHGTDPAPVEVPTPPETPETEGKSIEQQHREAIFGDTEPDDAVDAEDGGE